MKKYIQNKKKQLEADKTKFMDEAWDYFKKIEKLPPKADRLAFELGTKTQDIGEKWGAFKHTYTSASFTKKYGATKAKLVGDANEIIQFGIVKSLPSKKQYAPGNQPQDRRMDLKNNAAGRKIASKKSGNKLIDDVYYALDKDPDIVLNQNVNNNKPYKDNLLMNDIWRLADNSYKEKEHIEKFVKNTNKKINNIKNAVHKAKSFGQKLSEAREEKLKRYTQRLAESPQKTVEREAKHLSLEKLKEPQQSKINKVHDMIQKHEEKLKQKKSSSSGSIHVSAYKRGDGTDVSSYYRSR